jgi:fibronectin-binding autotransporter adhesin
MIKNFPIPTKPKTHMKKRPIPSQIQWFKKHITCVLLTMTIPLAVAAQQTVFYDTFGASSLEQTNIPGGIPGGAASDSTPFSATSYTIGSAKNALATTVGSGHLTLRQAATSSGNLDCQALFTKFPVSLASVGDYVELTYTFTDYSPIFQSTSAAATALFVGLFNSSGVAPQYGTTLANSGFSSSLTTADTGGTINWVGYSSQMYNYNYGWRIYARPQQTTMNNLNQGLLYNYPQTGGSGGFISPLSPNLTPGQQYTVQLRVTLSSASQLTVSNALYTGVDTSGTQFTNTSWVVTGANLLTTNFDSLAIGFRAGNSIIWTNDINSIKVVASLAAQAGPYYFVTSSGNPCAGGLTIGLSGSVTTNIYWLSTNGVNSGQFVAGTGSPISFGLQTVPATYTVIASNTVTSSQGPMYGSASVIAPGITITNQPASVSVVTNLPAAFSVGALGNALTYQWYKNGIALTNGGDVSGAQTANLLISPAQADDAATSANGYTVVVQDPCGDIVTSTPPAALTITAPRNLIWAGGNPDNVWDHSELNFILSSSPTAFAEGDDVTFDDSSANTSVAISNNVTPTLISVAGSSSYTFSGPNKITGIAQLVDSSSGMLTVVNNNDYSGGTIVSNAATLSLGDGSSTANNGSLAGIVTVMNGGNFNYNFAGTGNSTANLNSGLAGSGTNNCITANGSTIATKSAAVSSNFDGTINVEGFTSLHASDNNFGYALGNGSTINILQDGGQVWLDRSSTAYNNVFNIQGRGWEGSTPYTGAIRIFGAKVNGPINLLADARIGGTISGGTIQSVISGPYQLEVWGTTNSFVLTMGPTNGSPQAYASTLITAGAIRAANSNAISPGPLTLDSGGDMQVYGNNVTVSNLSSINSGQITLTDGPRVRNMHATIPGTLTVGTDGTSTEFDGTFSDGSTAPFGLTKIGNGTLTLTGVSSNTGPVTVIGGTIALSGSATFNKAPIVIGTGAFFDVSGIGGTLTLNSGQALKGNGTLAGSLVAPTGSMVQPGMPMGALAVSGSATINGIYQPNLNRTNVNNCSTFVASGGLVFSGATLSVTNVGPKLQAGDVFQLFPSATVGFTSYALQTNDALHNATYTWNNTVATDGKITVASVGNIVNPNPTNITASVTGTNLTLSWPSDHIGWLLQVQTNTLATGLQANWVNVPSSSATNIVTFPIGYTNGCVFYRMVFTNSP